MIAKSRVEEIIAKLCDGKMLEESKDQNHKDLEEEGEDYVQDGCSGE